MVIEVLSIDDVYNLINLNYENINLIIEYILKDKTNINIDYYNNIGNILLEKLKNIKKDISFLYDNNNLKEVLDYIDKRINMNEKEIILMLEKFIDKLKLTLCENCNNPKYDKKYFVFV